jgi:photosystem II stability/assembly factor-like uncharacterized protein
MSRLSFLGALVLLAGVQPDTAAANGRFPASTDVVGHPSDADVIALAVTYGLLMSRDGGETFYWVCEEAIGYGGTFDPDYVMADDGALWATTYDGLRVMRNGGCTWELIGGELADQWVQEVEIGPDGRIWAATANGARDNDIYVSTDGVTFESAGNTQTAAWFRTLRVAPTDADRIYASAYQVAGQETDAGPSGPAGLLFRTDDGGETWLSLDVDDLEGNFQLQIEAVSPTDPDVVFVRAVSGNPPLGDVMYRSIDGGESFARVLDTDDSIRVFEILSTGRIFVGTINDGVYYSDDGGVADSWARPTQALQMVCLTELANGDLLACGSNWEPDNMALGRSTDGGMTWTKVFRFAEMTGPVSCDPGTVQHDTCEVRLWPSLAEQFGVDRPTVDAGPGIDAGSGKENGGGTCGGCNAGGGLALLVLWPVLWRRRPPASSIRD